MEPFEEIIGQIGDISPEAQQLEDVAPEYLKFHRDFTTIHNRVTLAMFCRQRGNSELAIKVSSSANAILANMTINEIMTYAISVTGFNIGHIVEADHGGDPEAFFRETMGDTYQYHDKFVETDGGCCLGCGSEEEECPCA